MIELADWLRDELLLRARAEAPQEACGLISRAEPTDPYPEGRLHLWGAENVSQEPETSFVIAPRDQFGILRQLDGRREELIGVYHSHPNSDAAPSSRDRELARRWPGVTWLIVGLRGGAGDPDYFAGVLYTPSPITL